jgi:hypothetical protein
MSRKGEDLGPRWARAIQDKDMVAFLKELKTIKNLNEQLFIVPGLCGFSPLGFALLGYDKGHAEFVHVLLEKGADPNATCQWHVSGKTETAVDVALRQYDSARDTAKCLAFLKVYGGILPKELSE